MDRTATIQYSFRYVIRFQMFAVRQYSLLLFPRPFCSYFSHRYQSNSTNNSSTINNTEKSSTNVSFWATSDTNGLVKQLATRIKATGPITVAEFMRESLLNPKFVRSYLSLLYAIDYLSLSISTYSKNLVTIIILLGLLHTT